MIVQARRQSNSYRDEWKADPCQRKLSFELWTHMKAEGSAQNPNAKGVRESCHTVELGQVELITPEVWLIDRGQIFGSSCLLDSVTFFLWFKISNMLGFLYYSMILPHVF